MPAVCGRLLRVAHHEGMPLFSGDRRKQAGDAGLFLNLFGSGDVLSSPTSTALPSATRSSSQPRPEGPVVQPARSYYQDLPTIPRNRAVDAELPSENGVAHSPIEFIRLLEH